MSLFRYNPRDYFYTSPMERFIVNLLDNTFDDRSYRPLQSVAPYWLHQPVLNECNIGNTLGERLPENSIGKLYRRAQFLVKQLDLGNVQNI
ncbi:Small heat shock protein [Dirofilaria immitis]